MAARRASPSSRAENLILKRLSPYWLWLLLALPAVALAFAAATAADQRALRGLLHPTGEFSARFLIVAMMATPLMMLFRGWRGPRWLMRNRRYFGVAAFGYAALHAAIYLVAGEGLAQALAELPRFYIWSGWLAFLIFAPLAATSMDYAVRNLGRRWKALHRLTYAAALLTLFHWASLDAWQGAIPALINSGPLIALSAYRIGRAFGHSGQPRGAAPIPSAPRPVSRGAAEPARAAPQDAR